MLFLLLCSVSSLAQDGNNTPIKNLKKKPNKILFNQISTDLGLSQNVIIASLQDSTGFLWFGTRDGLNRFDGYEFKVYRNEPDDPGSLSNSGVTALFEDSQGRLWVGTENGLNLFDQTRESFHRLFSDNENNKKGLRHQSIRSITEDKLGAIWIGSVGGVDRLKLPIEKTENPLKKAKITYSTNDFEFGSERDNQTNKDTVRKVLIDEKGLVWVKTYFGRIFTLTKDESEDNYDIKRFRIENAGTEDSFPEFCFGKNGTIWLAHKKGLFNWSRKKRKATFYKFSNDFISENVNFYADIHEDRKGNIWLVGYWGLKRFNPKTEKFDFFPAGSSNHPKFEINPLIEYGINSILETESGAIWFGSNGNGIIRYDRESVRFAHFDEEKSKLSLWQETSVRSILETSDGTLLICGASGFCWKVDRKTGSTTPISGLQRVQTIYQDSSGKIWAGGGLPLVKLELQDGTIKKTDTYVLSPGRLGHVAKIFEDKAGDLWVVTGFELFQYNRQTNQFTGYLFDDSIEEWIYGVNLDMFEDAQNRFWIGTANGLILFDRTKKTFKRYKNDPKDTKSLSNNAVRTIIQDPLDNNILWLGTAGGGLNRFDTKSEMFTALTETDGLPNNVVYGILDDNNGNLWMSTNKGISRFDPRTLTFKNFDKKDGLQENEFNSSAYFKSSSGELFFGGIGGFNAFYPTDLKDNSHRPPVVITGFQILNKAVTVKSPDSPLKKAITETEQITLSYEQRFFAFEFAALDFTEPSKNQFAYQLIGFDKKQENIGNRRNAFYTNVPPGKYTFRVIASNNDGIWNNEGRSIEITILPPFWQTWWFRGLLILIGMGLLLLILYPYLSKLRHEKEMQESFAGQLIEEQEKDRKRIAGELHDELGQSLLIIKNRAFLGEKVTENKTKLEEKLSSAREQFSEISESVSEALEKVRDISRYLRPSQLERLGLTSAIEEMIERIDEASEIDFKFELPDLEGLFSKQNEINFYRIVQESLNNIIKHSGATVAIINVQNNAKEVELTVKDNGIGFVTEKVKKDKHRGFGLRGMSERTRLLDGKYTVISSPGKGTTVRVLIKKVE